MRRGLPRQRWKNRLVVSFFLEAFSLFFLVCVFLNGSLDGFFGSCRCKTNAWVILGQSSFFLPSAILNICLQSNTRRYPGVVSEGFGCGRFWTFTSISSRTFETETWAKEMPRSWGGDGQVMVSTVRLVVFPLILDVGWCHWLFINLPKKLVLLSLQVFPSQSASLYTVFRMCAALICCSFGLYLRRLWRGFRSAWHKLLIDAHPDFFFWLHFFFKEWNLFMDWNFSSFQCSSHPFGGNMYYLDPNIVRPLTASVQLSFAELVGPDEVGFLKNGTMKSMYIISVRLYG